MPRRDIKIIKEKVINEVSHSVPEWLRGLCVVQQRATIDLYYAIRDDTEQGSAYRVNKCLFLLGVKPLPTKKLLEILIKMCQGNSIAFLYFLLESKYKELKDTDDDVATPSNYTLNVQLLMSAIAFLDLPLVMHELDKVLPRGHLSKEDQKKHNAAVARKATARLKEAQQEQLRRHSFTRSVLKPKVLSKPTPAAPYFQPVPRPRILSRPKDRYNSAPPDFKARIERNDDAEVFAQRNRWFTAYELNPSRRIVKNIIDMELNKLFASVQSLNLSSAGAQMQSLCSVHKAEKELERKNFIKETGQRFLYLFHKLDRGKEASRKRIMKQLEQDIDKYITKYRLERLGEYNYVTTLKNAECVSCQQRILTPITKKQSNKLLVGECPYLKDINITDVALLRGKETTLKALKSNKDADAEFNEIICEYEKLSQESNLNILNEATNEEKSKTMEIYFHAADENTPHSFAYERVFAIDDFKFPDNTSTKSSMHLLYKNDKTQFISKTSVATKSSMNFLNENVRRNLDAAIELCVKNILHQAKQSENLMPLQPVEQQKLNFNINIKRDYYDPHNDALMSTMLSQALAVLAEDRRFVMPSFPDGHKIPRLFEWIKCRYGMKYNVPTKHEFNVVCQKLDVLSNMNDHIKYHVDRFFGEQFWSYKNINCAMAKATEVSKHIEQAMDSAIMEQNRYLWFSMQSFRFFSGQPQRTFFAYMPARNRDIIISHNMNHTK